jgi:hypothetical protein
MMTKDGRKKEQVSEKQEKLRQKLETDPVWAAEFRKRRALATAKYLENKKQQSILKGMEMIG